MTDAYKFINRKRIIEVGKLLNSVGPFKCALNFAPEFVYTQIVELFESTNKGAQHSAQLFDRPFFFLRENLMSRGKDCYYCSFRVSPGSKTLGIKASKELGNPPEVHVCQTTFTPGL